MQYDPQKHHRKSIRLKGYDYSKAGLYFIAICCRNMECLFGKIVWEPHQDEWVMQLKCWLKIPEHYPNVILHEYVVMPNHVHGIIELTQQTVQQPLQNHFQKIIPRSIGSIVRGYKTGVTKWFRSHTDIYKAWQRNLYEHIIRDEESYERISNYIINNPANWAADKFYKK